MKLKEQEKNTKLIEQEKNMKLKEQEKNMELKEQEMNIKLKEQGKNTKLKEQENNTNLKEQKSTKLKQPRQQRLDADRWRCIPTYILTYSRKAYPESESIVLSSSTSSSISKAVETFLTFKQT